MHVIKSNVQMFEFCKNRKWSVVLIHSYLNFEGKCQKPCRFEASGKFCKKGLYPEEVCTKDKWQVLKKTQIIPN